MPALSDDPETKDSFVLSPDGKYVAYSSFEGKGGSPYERHRSGSAIYLIDVAQVMKQLLVRK